MPALSPNPAPQSIDYFNTNHPLMSVQGRISVWIRQKMFNKIPLKQGMHVLEVGVTPDTNLLDSNFFSIRAKQAGCDVFVSSIEDCSQMAANHGFHWIPFDQLLADRSPRFDLVISSAVIEHVGPRDADKRDHLELLVHVSKQWIVVTTPNRSHWLEVHTKLPVLHWLPKSLHREILSRIGMKSWADPNHLDLLRAKEFQKLINESLPQTHVRFFHFWFLGWISNLMALIEKPSHQNGK